ncbi:hypothetical protein BJ878DRAFT_477922 [Calycina marina]|uniref:Uncharacterized protein n=1 Tax=Calycina marina TaxID=1763456 RepID=A0A9P8CHJ8_9HELO|nr:hypothetical protein BJ878DRAFT_477922 [Calycina marina]
MADNISNSVEAAEPKPIPVETLLQKLINFLVLVVGNLVLMAISSIIINNFQNPDPQTTLPLGFITLNIPDILVEPRQSVFMGATVLYLTALSSFPTPPHEDPFQAMMLVASTGSFAVSSALKKGDESWKLFALEKKGPLAAVVLFTLVLSLIGHTIIRAFNGKGSKAAVQEKKEN